MADAETFDPEFNCPTHFAGGDPSCPACVSKQPRPLRPADDAVEEAASVAAMLEEKRVLTVPTERVARWVAEHLAALRRAKGGTGG